MRSTRLSSLVTAGAACSSFGLHSDGRFEPSFWRTRLLFAPAAALGMDSECSASCLASAS